MYHDPIIPEESVMPELGSPEDPIDLKQSESSTLSESSGTLGESKNCQLSNETLSDVVVKTGLKNCDSKELELSKELEKILTDLEKNSFRECIAEALGREVDIIDSLSDKEFLSVESTVSEILGKESYQKPLGREPSDKFLYDSSTSEESLAPLKPSSNDLSVLDGIVAKFAPWREIFPPLYVYHRFPQRSLYWISAALKNYTQTISTN